MTWLLGTEAGVIIWATLLAAIGACIRYSHPGEAEAADWTAWEQEVDQP